MPNVKKSLKKDECLFKNVTIIIDIQHKDKYESFKEKKQLIIAIQYFIT